LRAGHTAQGVDIVMVAICGHKTVAAFALARAIYGMVPRGGKLACS